LSTEIKAPTSAQLRAWETAAVRIASRMTRAARSTPVRGSVGPAGPVRTTAAIGSAIALLAIAALILVPVPGGARPTATDAERLGPPPAHAPELQPPAVSTAAPEVEAPTRNAVSNLPPPPTTPDPFTRLELLAPDAIARLSASRDCTVASAEAAFDHLPPNEPDRAFARLYVVENLEREQAIRAELRAGRVYRDHFTFGTPEKQWFEEHGTELFRLHAHGIWAILLLESAQYPALAAARQAKNHAIAEVEHQRQALRARYPQRTSGLR